MGKKYIIGISLVLLALSLIAVTLLPTDESVDWWHIGGGGSYVSQGDLGLDSVVGQGIVGVTNQSGKEVCSGFLCLLDGLRLYLPLLLRNFVGG